jgi:hypothetical protein
MLYAGGREEVADDLAVPSSWRGKDIKGRTAWVEFPEAFSLK